jgi:predicted ester cyclase
MAGAPEARGSEECRAALGFLLEAWPDQQFDIQEIVAHDGGRVCRSILTGTLAKLWNLGGTVVEPRGQRVSFGILDVMTCRESLIVRKEVRLDGRVMTAALM